MYKILATTLFLGKNVVFMPECHSTNDFALQLCQKQSPAEGTLIITAHQTAGRGQRGNSWEAEPNQNLTFSIIIKPSLLIGEQFYLNIFTSLGILRCITEITQRKVQIKWPNDIVFEGEKICGILIENQIQGNYFENSVIGIGLNVNQQKFQVPTATSLRTLTTKHYALQEVLELVVQHIEKYYLLLKAGKFEILKQEYLNNLYWLDEVHQFTAHGTTFTGRISGIDGQGKLQVETLAGCRSFDVKEVSYCA